MPYTHPSRAYTRQYRAENNRNLPEFDALVFYYPFTEGQVGAGSMNNIIFDRYSQVAYGAEEITNADFTGTYVGGVAPGWSADPGVTATEDTSEPGLGSGQRLVGCNGVAQGLRRGATDSITASGIFVVTFTYKKNGGAGNIQLQLTGMGGMTADTYDIVPETGPKTNTFYIAATTTATTVAIITSDNPTLDFTVFDFSMKEITGGNPMVMDFNVYVDSQRNGHNYDFNGVDQFFYIPDARQTDLEVGSSPFTFAAIIKADAGNSTIFSKRRDGGNFEYDFKTIVSRALRLQFTDDGSTLESIASSGLVTLGVNTFVAAGVNLATGLGNMSINGVDQTITYSPAPLTHTTVFGGNARAAIGCTFNAGNAPTNFFNGTIGECCLWKGAMLSDSQMLQAFNFLRTGHGI